MLPLPIRLGCLWPWKRPVTQTIWLDDICPAETDGQKKTEKRWNFQEVIMLQLERKKGGRRDFWAEWRVNNYNMMIHSFGVQLKEDRLSPLNMNFLFFLFFPPLWRIACCSAPLRWSSKVTVIAAWRRRVGGGITVSNSAGELLPKPSKTCGSD